MKILGVCNVYNSKRDVYGNRYFAMEYTNTETGKVVRGHEVASSSNVEVALRERFPYKEFDVLPVVINRIELPIREYNRMVHSWKYIGSSPVEINNAIDETEAEPVSLYDKAHRRMESMYFNPQQMTFIFSDWPEGEEHYKWLLTASRQEITSWGDSAYWGVL